jgi:hypothetical protein
LVSAVTFVLTTSGGLVASGVLGTSALAMAFSLRFEPRAGSSFAGNGLDGQLSPVGSESQGRRPNGSSAVYALHRVAMAVFET